MENEIENFDLDAMMAALKSSSTYDEFRIKCDFDNNECIITREEFDSIRSQYAPTPNNDIFLDNIIAQYVPCC